MVVSVSDLGRKCDALHVSTAILLEQHRGVRNSKAIQENLACSSNF